MKKNYSEFSVSKGLSLNLTRNLQKPKTNRFLNPKFIIGAISLLFSGAAYSQYQTLPISSGYTDDVIANGVGNASASVTNNVDGGNYAFVSNDFQATSSATAPAYGLPVTGVINSAVAATTGLTYQLAPFTGNNSLRLAAINSTGTLTLTTPATATTLYVLATSGGAISTFSVTINFSDNTTQVATAQSMPDWFNSTALPVAASGFGRINFTNNGLENPSGNPRLYQLAIDIPVANQGKTIQSVLFNKTAAAGYLQIFALSAKQVPACPVISAASVATTSFTSADLSWTLGTMGAGATAVTYTAEVYTDAAYTAPITGSPFTTLTTTQSLTGLTLGTQYYYRIKANNGTCDSAYFTGTFTPNYCVPTVTSTSYNFTAFSTTGGYTNITNTGTGSGAYNNYSATQIVSKPAGTSFNYSATTTSTLSKIAIYVDWNNDLDFDDAGETVATGSGVTAYNGTIAIPAGTSLGNHRMRIRSTYNSTTYVLAPCGNIYYGETEDYTLNVVAAPADCTAPDAPAITASATGATISGTITPLTTAPTGYILVRSSLSALTQQPVTGASYAVGAELGGGTVIANSATLTTFSNFVGANTRYYYFVYAYNDNGSACFGPKYSVAGVANAVSCAKAVQVASASNITHNSAILNWSNIVGIGGVAATYTVEVYTDAALTALFGSYTSTTPSYTVTGLTNGVTYYYRVKGEAGTCDDDSWSATSSFVAQNSYTPLNATGYNADVIANGTGIANVSTTNAVDAVNNCYVALDYERVSGTVTTIGLPLNRTLTSSALTGLKFLMPDYSTFNSLRLPAQNQAGTLALTNPVKLTDLYLAVTSGSGASTISAQIQFQDGTSQAATSISLIDWYQAGTGTQPALISNIGRANRADATGNIETGNSKVFYVTIPVDAANQSKLVSGVLVTKTSTGATEPVPNIFAISGKAIEVCPTLATATAGTPTSEGATLTWTAVANAAPAVSYTVEIYTDAAFTTPVTGSPFTGITAATYTATGLNPMTTYYFRVKAINADCTSAYVTGSFTTACATPAAPTAAAQTFCGSATVAGLTATGVTGATFKWYATNTSTEVLAPATALTTGLYFVSQTISTCESARTAVSVTVNTTAAPTAAAQSFCGSATVSQLVATTLTGAPVTWSATQGGTALEGTAALATGTYYVTQTLNGCTSAATAVAVTISALPSLTITNPAAACAPGTVDITAASVVAGSDAGLTYSYWADPFGTVTFPAPTAITSSGTFYIKAENASGCSVISPVVVVVNVTPVPTATAQTFCAGATVADLDATGTNLAWSATQGGTVLADTEALVTGTYYVTQTVDGCASAATAVEVTVNTTPAPVAAAQTFCIGATAAELEATAETGATLTWYATEGGTALTGTEALATGTYYVTQTLNGCVSVAATVAVTVNTTPAPMAAAQSFCQGATAAELEATTAEGATVTWSATEGGSALTGTETLATGTYYVWQTLNGCVSAVTAVVVTVNAISGAPTGEATQTFVEGSGDTVADLEVTTAEGATVTWYVQNDAMEYVEVPATTALVDGETYFATQSLNGCESTYFGITVSQVAGVEGFGLSRLVVYPNPTKDVVTLTNSETITKVEVVNLLGQTVVAQNPNAESVQVDLTNLASGTYMVRLATANATATVKVVKQ